MKLFEALIQEISLPKDGLNKVKRVAVELIATLRI